MNKNKLPHELAVDLLSRSPSTLFQVSAVIFDKHGIFNWGWNHYLEHAEEHAIHRANPKRLAGSTIVVACRARNNPKKLHLARPCAKCFENIVKKNIAKIIYSNPKSPNIWSEEII